MTATAPDVAREQPNERDTDVDDPSRRRLPRILGLVLCAVLVGGAAIRVAIHDPTSVPVSGDQSSFVLQALSIQEGDLSFDEQDHERWLELEWDVYSRGLFLQKRDAGWAFAKPYGYSVLLAPAIGWFGAYGITLVGSLLLLAYAWCWYAIGRTRWRPLGAAFVATAATVASNAFPMAFPAHADLFVAVLVGLVVVASVRMIFGGPVSRSDPSSRPAPLSRVASWIWPCVAAGAAGMLVTEKLPALVAIAPLLALALWRSSWRGRLLTVGLGAVVVGVSIIPYLHYSDGASWSAYGGDRYYAQGETPFGGGDPANLLPWQTAETMSPDTVIENLLDPSDDLPSAALTYAVGRHTGAITHQPLIATLGVASVIALVVRRRRRGEDTGERAGLDDPDGDQPWTLAFIAAGVGLLGYITLYLITFTDNYFGGGQSVGNRYYLQVSVLLAVLPVTARVTERAARWASIVAGALALVLITPHLTQPEDAFYHLERTSPAQELLPFDGSQSGNWRFTCDPDETCEPPPMAPILGG